MSQMTLTNISWFKKYQPKKIEEYVFENDDQKNQIVEWINNGTIPGNVLLYGNAGTGKSALAQLLIRSIIKSQYDVEKLKDKKVETIDSLHIWCQKQPVSSKQKIVYIEEMDRMSIQAFNSLKDGLMENYQPHVAFVATTNFLNRVEYAVQTRFNFRFNLNCSNLEGIFNRLSTILKSENIEFDDQDLKKFIESNSNIGLRNLINILQINCKNNTIDFNNIKTIKSEQEEIIIQKTLEIFKKVINNNNFNEKSMCYRLPLSSIIAEEYNTILETTNYNYDLNYTTIFIELFEKINLLPLKVITENYLNEIENKRYQNITFVSYLYKCIKCLIDLTL